MKEWQESDFGIEVQEDNHGFIDLFKKLLANWYWFALSGILGLAIAFLYLRYSTPMFKINARLLVSDEQKGSSGLANSSMGDFGIFMSGVSSVENEAEILKTRLLMEQVVRQLNAQVTYYHPGKIRNVEIHQPPFKVSILASDSLRSGTFTLIPIDETKARVTQDDLELEIRYEAHVDLPGIGTVRFTRNPIVDFQQERYLFNISTFDGKVSEYLGRLSVGVSNKQVSIIDLAFDYPLRQKGEEILNTIIQVYTANSIRDKNTIADSTLAFIDNRLLYVGQELSDVEGDIQVFRQQRQLADFSTQSQLLLENSSEYVKQLSEVETQLNILSELEQYLTNDDNKRVLPSAILPQDMVFNGMVERYNNLLIERDRRLLSATEDNPMVRNLDQQIANIRNDIQANLRTTRDRLAITRDGLQRKTGQLETEVNKVPATERAYLDLMRQQQIKQELYVYLLTKREETAISKTANISSSKVIDPPKAATLPFSPRRTSRLFIGLLVGLAIPFGIIYLRDLFNTRIQDKDDVSQRTQVPILSEISHNREKETLIVQHNPRSPIAEQFRALRTNLAFYLKDKSQKTILLTSSMSGEGKSFLALNLGIILAISGKKVVVMEMDLRKPNLSVKLGITNNFGYTNYAITSSLTPKEIVVPSKVHEQLHLISSGPVPPNPAETLLSERLDTLMAYLRQTFDYIIIDAPPIGLVTDAQLLAQYADLTLYVVRQGYTQKNQIPMVEELYTQRKMKQLALLINDIPISQGYGYGYYDQPAKKGRNGWLTSLFRKTG